MTGPEVGFRVPSRSARAVRKVASICLHLLHGRVSPHGSGGEASLACQLRKVAGLAHAKCLASSSQRVSLFNHQTHGVLLDPIAVDGAFSFCLFVHCSDLLQEPLSRLPAMSESRGLCSASGNCFFVLCGILPFVRQTHVTLKFSETKLSEF